MAAICFTTNRTGSCMVDDPRQFAMRTVRPVLVHEKNTAKISQQPRRDGEYPIHFHGWQAPHQKSMLTPPHTQKQAISKFYRCLAVLWRLLETVFFIKQGFR